MTSLAICSCNFDKEAKNVHQKNENLKQTALSQLAISMKRIKPRPSLIPRAHELNMGQRSHIRNCQRLPWRKFFKDWRVCSAVESIGTQFPAPTWWIKLSVTLVPKALVPSSGHPRHGTRVGTDIHLKPKYSYT